MEEKTRGWTAGPWKVFVVQGGPNKGQFLGVGQITGEGVTDAYGGLWGSGPEQMATAHLIAAAPDLYEALDGACDVLEAIAGQVEGASFALNEARAALLKANPTREEGKDNG